MSPQQAVQESEYALPVHWLATKAVKVRYARTSKLMAELVLRYLPEGGSVIDVGCGDGRGTFDVHTHLGQRFTIRGVDYSERAVLLAQAMTHGSSLRFDVVRAGELASKNLGNVDCLIYREIIEHLTDEELSTTLQSVHGMLRRDGIIVVSVPSTNTPLSSKHYRHYTGELLRATLEQNGFCVVELLGFGHQPKWLRFTRHLYELPKFWKLLNPLWRRTALNRAHTLIAVGCKDRTNDARSPAPGTKLLQTVKACKIGVGRTG